MKNSFKKTLIIIFSILLVISSLISAITIFIYNENNLDAYFIPSKAKSFPNHTSWILLDIKQKDYKSLPDLDIEINTNTPILLDYIIWNTTRSEKVVEIFLYPNITHLNKEIDVKASLHNGFKEIEKYAKIQIIDWSEGNISKVEPMRDAFISFLAENHSYFNINSTINWRGFTNSPMTLVVEHYLFISEYWELELARHVTTPPHDWVRVYIRPRSQTTPIWAGEIKSWNSGSWNISEITPPEKIYR